MAKEKVAKIRDVTPEDVKQELGVRKIPMVRSCKKRPPTYVNKLIRAVGGQVQAAELLGMSGPGINAIVRGNEARITVELAAEYLYKTHYAGNVGEAVQMTNNKKLDKVKGDLSSIDKHLTESVKFMQDGNQIKAYDMIRSSLKSCKEAQSYVK